MTFPSLEELEPVDLHGTYEEIFTFSAQGRIRHSVRIKEFAADFAIPDIDLSVRDLKRRAKAGEEARFSLFKRDHEKVKNKAALAAVYLISLEIGGHVYYTKDVGWAGVRKDELVYPFFGLLVLGILLIGAYTVWRHRPNDKRWRKILSGVYSDEELRAIESGRKIA